ncbi:hypothetical protein EDC04DRAFT_2609635 [Pisolithus marmoratus]|nr:hypothetical protein EDC04DRAFT_2609635 [Pisolithus marmoratus]
MPANMTTTLLPSSTILLLIYFWSAGEAGVLGSTGVVGEAGIWGTGMLGMLGRAWEDGQSGAKSVPAFSLSGVHLHSAEFYILSLSKSFTSVNHLWGPIRYQLVGNPQSLEILHIMAGESPELPSNRCWRKWEKYILGVNVVEWLGSKYDFS